MLLHNKYFIIFLLYFKIYNYLNIYNNIFCNIFRKIDGLKNQLNIIGESKNEIHRMAEYLAR